MTELLAVKTNKVSAVQRRTYWEKPHPSNASELKGHINLDDKRDHTSSQGGVGGRWPKSLTNKNSVELPIMLVFLLRRGGGRGEDILPIL